MYLESTLLTLIKTLNNLFSPHIKGVKRSILAGFILVVLKNKTFSIEELKHKQNITDTILYVKSFVLSAFSTTINKAFNYKLINSFFESSSILKTNFLQIITFIQTNLFTFLSSPDLINLFFTIFNKYIGKQDKNQAFTPAHIAGLISKMLDLNTTDKVLDPTAGSGTFLVQSILSQPKNTNQTALNTFINQNIYGIEYDENVYLLLAINLLLHNDTTQYLFCDSCFNKLNINYFYYQQINKVLMNPPFNASRILGLPDECPVYQGTKQKAGNDATKGLYFVYKTANAISYCYATNEDGKVSTNVINSRTGYLAAILPVQCAKGGKGYGKDIDNYKSLMMQNHTLLAVCLLPADLFQPGTNVQCCLMLWKTGINHKPTDKVFLADFSNDGYYVAKHLEGRIRKADNNWEETEKKWLKAYQDKLEIDGFCTNKILHANDNWLPNVYLKQEQEVDVLMENLKTCVDDYFMTLIQNKQDMEVKKEQKTDFLANSVSAFPTSFNTFTLSDLFTFTNGKRITKQAILKHPGLIPVIGGGGFATSYLGFVSTEINHKNDKIYCLANTLSVVRNGSVGSVHFYKYPVFVSDSSFVLHLKTDIQARFTSDLLPYILIFFQASLKPFQSLYSYNNPINPQTYLQHKIKLPIDKNGDIDFNKMINMVQKLIQQKIKTLTNLL